MTKTDAILWFFSDWNGGTLLLTRPQKGAYMDLLSAQFHNGHLSPEAIHSILAADYEKMWPVLRKKFLEDLNGNFYNRRLEEEMNRRTKYVKSRQLNLGLEGEEEKTKRFVPPTVEEVQAYFEKQGVTDKEQAKLFIAFYTSKGWKVGKEKMVSWHSAVSGWVVRLKKQQPAAPGKIDLTKSKDLLNKKLHEARQTP